MPSMFVPITMPSIDLLLSIIQRHEPVLIQRFDAKPVGTQEFGLFVRSDAQFDRAKAAAEDENVTVLHQGTEGKDGQISICTIHLAEILEFCAVAVIACDDEVIPLQDHIENICEDADLQEVYYTERHLLYVA